MLPRWPQNTESEAGTPQTSEYGQSMQAGIAGTMNKGTILPGPNRYLGFYGKTGTGGAKVIPLTHTKGYSGDVSLDLQPQGVKPKNFIR